MARTRKGNPVSGWVVVDKPAGPGSTEVVARIRRAFDAQKAGHAGTLDPAATGVLAVALGEATKTVPFVTDATKAYRFTIRLGAETTTDDAEGAVTATSDLRPTDAALAAALERFLGETLQVPPAFSAVKVAGARAYDLAREGAVPDLAARPLRVEAIALLARPDADHAVVEMTCGKGGYVRAVARDLGRALGCLAHVAALRRLWSGPFREADAVPLAAIEAADPAARAALLRPTEIALSALPRAQCPPGSAARLRNGNPAPVIPGPGALPGALVWAEEGGRAVAIGRYIGGMLHPDRVLAAAP